MVHDLPTGINNVAFERLQSLRPLFRVIMIPEFDLQSDKRVRVASKVAFPRRDGVRRDFLFLWSPRPNVNELRRKALAIPSDLSAFACFACNAPKG